MKSSTKLLGTMILVVLLFTGMLFGQSLEERLQSMVAKNAEMYMNPLATAFGSGMNSGWFHSAKPHKLLGFDFGVRAMAVTFPDDQKMFNFDISQLEDYNFSTTISDYSIEMTAADLYPNTEVPTILGKNKTVDVRASKDQLVQIITDQMVNKGANADAISAAGTLIEDAAENALKAVPKMEIKGTGLDFIPLVVPQAAVGLSLPMLPIKAEIVVRGMPEVEISKELGSLQFFGGGAKLALDPFIPIPMFPVNIAVGAYTQKMTLGSVFEANNTLMSLMVGKDLNLMSLGLGVYGAVGLESSNIKIKYDLELPDGTVSPVRFDMKGDNKFRTTIGGRIRLAVININADYSVGADNVFTVGAGISIR